MAQKQKTTLRDMAQDAKAMLNANPGMNYVYRQLAHGLMFVLQPVGENRWRLAIARHDTHPSDTELDIVRNAFGIPAGVDFTKDKYERAATKGPGTLTYYRLQAEWLDYTNGFPTETTRTDHALAA